MHNHGGPEFANSSLAGSSARVSLWPTHLCITAHKVCSENLDQQAVYIMFGVSLVNGVKYASSGAILSPHV
jgi:hypothetical protein